MEFKIDNSNVRVAIEANKISTISIHPQYVMDTLLCNTQDTHIIDNLTINTEIINDKLSKINTADKDKVQDILEYYANNRVE